MVKKVTRYHTDQGDVFPTYDQAVRHETLLTFIDWWEETTGDTIGVHAAAEWLDHMAKDDGRLAHILDAWASSKKDT